MVKYIMLKANPMGPIIANTLSTVKRSQLLLLRFLVFRLRRLVVVAVVLVPVVLALALALALVAVAGVGDEEPVVVATFTTLLDLSIMNKWDE